MEQFEQIDLDEISDGDLDITNIGVKVKNDNHENVQITFKEEKNALGVIVTETYIDVHVNWKYSKLFVFKVSGTADIKGKINVVGMDLAMGMQLKEELFNVPSVSIQGFDLDLDTDSFDFEFDCDLCPSKVLNLILDAFKGPLLNMIKDQARDVVNKDVVDTVNQMLLEQYPTSIAVNEKLSISTSLAAPVSVKANYVSGPIDGTVFLTAVGYNVPFDSPELPITDE
jgi:hypothetical protein